MEDLVALRVNGAEISLQELLSGAKFRGQLDFVEQCVDRALVRAAAERMGIAVPDEELQQAADDFRTARKLYAAQATQEWLAAHHLMQEDWEVQLEDDLLWHKVRTATVGGKIEQYFAENRLAFDTATISRILIAEESVARELRAQCVDDEVPFCRVALPYAAESFTGRLRRSQMEPMLASAVFGAQPGEVAGPVRTERGWNLVLVESLEPAALDDETREEIARALFAEWLREERRSAKVEMPVLTEW